MYNVLRKIFYSYDGKPVLFHHRNETTDINTILSILQFDEYKIKEIGIKDGEVIIDIGSHIGGLPLLLSTLAKNLGVYCYEPIPENHRLLFRNIEDNDLQGMAYPSQKAVVGKAGGTIKIYYGDDSFAGLAHKFIGTPCKNPPKDWNRKFVEAETITLEQIFKDNKITHCRLLKIDCEGFEYEIFEHTPKEILEKIDYIVGERHAVSGTTDYATKTNLMKFTKGIFEDISGAKNEVGLAPIYLKNKKIK